MTDPKDVVLAGTLEAVLAQLRTLGFRHVVIEYVDDPADPESGFYYADVWEQVHVVCAIAHEGDALCEDCDDEIRAFSKDPLEALKTAATAAVRLRSKSRVASSPKTGGKA